MYELKHVKLGNAWVVDMHGSWALHYADWAAATVKAYPQKLPTQLQPLGRWSGDAAHIIWNRHV